MTSKTIQDLAKDWVFYKSEEEKATNHRRMIEDQIVNLAGIKETLEGTENINIDGFELKIVGRIDRKVDAEKVQEIAAEFDLTAHLSSLFRWKPELNMSAWKAADEAITKPLSNAITAKPGRPSFKITVKE